MIDPRGKLPQYLPMATNQPAQDAARQALLNQLDETRGIRDVRSSARITTGRKTFTSAELRKAAKSLGATVECVARQQLRYSGHISRWIAVCPGWISGVSGR